jgi:hypothetical protein
MFLVGTHHCPTDRAHQWCKKYQALRSLQKGSSDRHEDFTSEQIIGPACIAVSEPLTSSMSLRDPRKQTKLAMFRKSGDSPSESAIRNIDQMQPIFSVRENCTPSNRDYTRGNCVHARIRVTIFFFGSENYCVSCVVRLQVRSTILVMLTRPREDENARLRRMPAKKAQRRWPRRERGLSIHAATGGRGRQ